MTFEDLLPYIDDKTLIRLDKKNGDCFEIYKLAFMGYEDDKTDVDIMTREIVEIIPTDSYNKNQKCLYIKLI